MRTCEGRGGVPHCSSGRRARCRHHVLGSRSLHMDLHKEQRGWVTQTYSRFAGHTRSWTLCLVNRKQPQGIPQSMTPCNSH
jgi:hypothetical protein